MGWGSSTRRGGGRKVRALESLSSLDFEEKNLGCPDNFAGISRTLGLFKMFVQKKFVRIFRSLMLTDTSLQVDHIFCEGLMVHAVNKELVQCLNMVVHGPSVGL